MDNSTISVKQAKAIILKQNNYSPVSILHFRLRIREELDFYAGLITSYGYEVYRGPERLYWYDDFPHPNDTNLALTLPHHKHVPPDIKHNRISAPKTSFNQPNLPVIIREIEDITKSRKM